MSEYEKKEKAEGMWDGEKVRFSRVWRGHRFTDEEVGQLLAGQEISVRGLVSATTGKIYGVHGKLTRQSFDKDGEKIDFVGFEHMGFLPTEGVPDEWCQHKFTDDEKADLEAGKSLYITGFVSRGGKEFDARIEYKAEDGKPGKRIVPSFGAN